MCDIGILKNNYTKISNNSVVHLRMLESLFSQLNFFKEIKSPLNPIAQN